MTTGDEFVVKRPLQKLINSDKVDHEIWRSEAEIMQSVSHVRIASGVPNYFCYTY